MNDAAIVEYYPTDQWEDSHDQNMGRATTVGYRFPVHSKKTLSQIRPRRSTSVRAVVEEFFSDEGEADRESSLTEYEYLTGDIEADAIKVAADVLERSLFADDSDTVYSLEEEALRALSSSYQHFAFIALNQQYAPDVRGVAARLFAESAKDDEQENTLLLALAASGQPLVRLGLVYGLEDKTNRELLQQFVGDPHPRVREEARRLQASA